MREHSRLVYLALAGIAAAVVLAAAGILLTAELDAGNAHEKFEWHWWATGIAIIGGAAFLYLGYVVLGFTIRLWTLPEIKEGPSYWQQFTLDRRTRRARKEQHERRRENTLRELEGRLAWFEQLLRAAEESGNYWRRSEFDPHSQTHGWIGARLTLQQDDDLAVPVEASDLAFAEIDRVAAIAFQLDAGPVNTDHRLGDALQAIRTAQIELRNVQP